MEIEQKIAIFALFPIFESSFCLQQYPYQRTDKQVSALTKRVSKNADVNKKTKKQVLPVHGGN